MKPNRVHVVALAIFVVLFILALGSAEANGRWGGARPGVIDDRPQTVRDIEERADIRWAVNTAEQWTDEDDRFCRKANGNAKPYARCMIRRLNTRLLYMLRRGCVGGHGISEICQMPLLEDKQ